MDLGCWRTNQLKPCFACNRFGSFRGGTSVFRNRLAPGNPVLRTTR